MRVSRIHSLIALYVSINDQLTPVVHRGRQAMLRGSEVITILSFNLFVSQRHTIRQIYDWVVQYHQRGFPRLPRYQNSLKHCHRVVLQIGGILNTLLMCEATSASWIPLRLKYGNGTAKIPLSGQNYAHTKAQVVR